MRRTPGRAARCPHMPASNQTYEQRCACNCPTVPPGRHPRTAARPGPCTVGASSPPRAAARPNAPRTKDAKDQTGADGHGPTYCQSVPKEREVPELARALGLGPHPEGGWFRETYRSSVTFEPDGYDGPRAAATAIYYLLQPGEESRWHVVASDELWLWHRGGALEISLGGARSRSRCAIRRRSVLGQRRRESAAAAGARAGRHLAGGTAGVGRSRCLVTCVVAPGFDFADFRLADGRRPAVREAHQLGHAVVSSGGVAAVDGDRLSGEERRVRRQQERGRRGDLVRMAPPAKRVLARELGRDVLHPGHVEHALRERRVDEARTDRVRTDARPARSRSRCSSSAGRRHLWTRCTRCRRPCLRCPRRWRA